MSAWVVMRVGKEEYLVDFFYRVGFEFGHVVLGMSRYWCWINGWASQGTDHLSMQKWRPIDERNGHEFSTVDTGPHVGRRQPDCCAVLPLALWRL